MIDHRDADCLHWRELLAVLPPDELSPSDQKALDAHLRSCPTCTSVRDQYRTLSAIFRDLSSDAPPPGIAIPLTSAQAGTYARITFAHPIDTYDAALYTVINTGLALADFCYEQGRDKYAKQHQEPTWHPMGQEKSFARTHSLVVTRTKRVTSSLWREQLLATPGVIAIASPYTTPCP